MALGVALISSASLLALLVVFGAWRRLPSAAALPILGGLGFAAGAGALLVQDRASVAEWAVTTIVLGILTPLHARLVFGRPGRAR